MFMKVCSYPTRGERDVSSTSQISASYSESRVDLNPLVMSPLSAGGSRSSTTFLQSLTASASCRWTLVVESPEAMSSPSTLVLSLAPASRSSMLVLKPTPLRRSESESIGTPCPMSPSGRTCDGPDADPNAGLNEFRSSPCWIPGTPLVPSSCRTNSI